MPNGFLQTVFYDKLFEWYNIHHRCLPWRETNDPYVIWISEIILQQTRVAQGLDYFNRFIYRFPNVESLAIAPEDEILKYWQGLGYYSRARNLHKAAKTIYKQHGGVFPSEYKLIRELKGIGDYTAAAIVSFAWDQPYAVVDGNVYRLLSRLFSLAEPINSSKGKRVFKELAEELLYLKKPGLYNQAIMEFGALQCTPQKPNCFHCPLSDFCQAFHHHQVSDYPVKPKKKKSIERYLNYFQIIFEDYTWIHKRTHNDIWKGLYEFPLIETDEATCINSLLSSEILLQWLGEKPILENIKVVIPEIKHVLSHQIIHASFYQIRIKTPAYFPDSFLKIKGNELGGFAFSKLIQKFLKCTCLL